MGAAADFPSEVRVNLRDGSRAVVRPIRPDDKETIARGFEKLSEQSRYQRFMAPVDHLSPSQLSYLTEVDHHDHEALVAFDAESGEGVGVGRFVRLEDVTSAEAAVTIIDEWQGRGLGTAICNLLAARAREEGIERFKALLLASNEQMQDVLTSLGPAHVLSRESGTLEIEVEIPEAGIGDHMSGVLRAVAGTDAIELATPPWGHRQLDDPEASG
jgi:RimJ/RimL family protein N-acetyltransferase